MSGAEPRPELRVPVELDLPGETARQARVLLLWFVCLATAIAVAVIRRPTSDEGRRDDDATTRDMGAYRREAFAIAFGIGLLIPALLNGWITHRRRRGGPHARGITVAITGDGEVRIWGRGYGQRLALAGAVVEERLVDVFTGRLGAWRQRRMHIRAKQSVVGMPGELELATLADDRDLDGDLPLVGGEGDCMELSREHYLEVRRLVREHAKGVVA